MMTPIFSANGSETTHALILPPKSLHDDSSCRSSHWRIDYCTATETGIFAACRLPPTCCRRWRLLRKTYAQVCDLILRQFGTTKH